MRAALLTLLVACTGCQELDGAILRLSGAAAAPTAKPTHEVTDNTTELLRYVNELQARVQKLEANMEDSFSYGTDRDSVWIDGSDSDSGYVRHYLDGEESEAGLR